MKEPHAGHRREPVGGKGADRKELAAASYVRLSHHAVNHNDFRRFSVRLRPDIMLSKESLLSRAQL